MKSLITLAAIVLVFSVLSVFELVYLKKKGIDVLAHLEISRTQGRKGKFFFEAVGAIAFVLGQPILLTALVVWASKNVNLAITNSLMNLLQFLR